MSKRFLTVLIMIVVSMARAGEKPVLVVFDFEDLGDEKQIGKWVANNIRSKASKTGKTRLGWFVTIEGLDRDSIVVGHQFFAKLDSNPDEVVAFARENFAPNYVMWGRVVREGSDALRLHVKAARLAAEGYELVLSENLLVVNQYMIGPTAVDLLYQLMGRNKEEEEKDPAAERRWKEGPNLVTNGGFERGRTHPDGWEPFGVDWQHKCASWVKAPDQDGRGKCIKFDIPGSIAATYGAAYYSNQIDVTPGAQYRFSIRVKSMRPTVKIFIKHYGYFPPMGRETKGQWREVARSPLNCKGSGGKWKYYQRDVNPPRFSGGLDRYGKPAQWVPKKTRIGLYAYWPAGVVYFDDVVYKKIREKSPKHWGAGAVKDEGTGATTER